MDPPGWDGPTHGKVMLYVDRELNSDPYMSFTSKVTSELPVVLKQLSGRFSPIQKRNSRIYVYQENAWEVKGRFCQAMEDDTLVQWNMDDDNRLSLHLLAVGVILILSTFVT